MIADNKKGFSLMEIMVAMMIVGLISTLTASLFIFGLQSFNTTTRQIHQHDIVTEITRRISKDIQEASACHVKLEVTLGDINSYSELYLEFPTPSGITPAPSAPNWKCWKIQNGKLYLMIGPKNKYENGDYNPNNFKEILSGLDTGQYQDNLANTTLYSRFQRFNDTLELSIKPSSTNTTIHKNKNIIKPIISEYSVKYKEDLVIP